MEKIFSKIQKTKLLHIISKKLPEGIKRLDLTDNGKPLQVSRINLKNIIIKPHSNNSKSLNLGLVEQNECWIVLNGKIDITLFDTDKTKIENRTLHKSEILITCGGGHSINNTSEDAEIIEVKLGPFENNNLTYY